MSLPDVQDSPDTRNIPIDYVGISDVRYPLSLDLRSGGRFDTVANIAMHVSCAAESRGIHMSRLSKSLNDWKNRIRLCDVWKVIAQMQDAQEQGSGRLRLTFPIFLDRKAPVSKESGLMDYDCYFEQVQNGKKVIDCVMGIKAKVKTLCPCSKEISDRGAHNQRSVVEICVRPGEDTFIWFEDLIDIAEKCGSSQLYPVLKRVDEKHVTESAYDNPHFVEDVVRDGTEHLTKLLEKQEIAWFYVSSTNHESIHSHNAYGEIERGKPGIIHAVW